MYGLYSVEIKMDIYIDSAGRRTWQFSLLRHHCPIMSGVPNKDRKAVRQDRRPLIILG